jgi:hypothetical protein
MNHSEIINEYKSGFGCVCEDTVIGCRKKAPDLKTAITRAAMAREENTGRQ